MFLAGALVVNARHGHTTANEFSGTLTVTNTDDHVTTRSRSSAGYNVHHLIAAHVREVAAQILIHTTVPVRSSVRLVHVKVFDCFWFVAVASLVIENARGAHFVLAACVMFAHVWYGTLISMVICGRSKYGAQRTLSLGWI